MSEFGLLPKEYNPKVHGPYFPGRYYGKPDTPFAEVKLGELGAWLSRRSKSPIDMGKAFGRFGWRWWHKWMMPTKTTFAPFLQVALTISAIRYIQDYKEHKNHRHAKYH
ncbi:hypothetical protein Ciccas_010310 [Cichlidogyrus casuarinus]|uniref:Mitochondrial ATP synthase F chain n=1 Tax=Cichlidogyrus casuarinus TaxID=1844966 RepID=A0ABD2PUG4_9PLAT